MSQILQPVEPNDRFQLRREARRKQVRRRRLTALGVGALVVAVPVAALTLLPGDRAPRRASAALQEQERKPAAPIARAMPKEIRGLHVTMALAPRIGEYVALASEGLNTIELDIKDENGEVGFTPKSVPLAKAIGATRDYYDPGAVARKVHGRGLYLIGRIVAFEDPILAEKRPGRAIQRRDGSVWRNYGGLGWTNPYDRRVWKYLVDLGAAAVEAGFDEIQYDYVRFPSDGDLSDIRYPGRHTEPMGWAIPLFLKYASKRLKPLGARVSADVFGLAATRDLGIGQNPRRIANVVDAIYPMVYPSHFNSGEYDLPDPNGAPGETVLFALRDFRHQVKGRKAVLVPWLQDFTLGRTYTLSEIRDQIEAARLQNARGYMLWNAAGVYTRGAFTS